MESILEKAKNELLDFILSDDCDFDMFDQVPQNLFTLIEKYRKAHLEQELERTHQEELARKKLEERKKQEQEKAWKRIEKLLYPTSWASKVPIARRFVIASRTIKEYTGFRLSNPEQDTNINHWRDREESCGIDLIRGKSCNYFGYNDFVGLHDHTYRESIKPLLEAKNEQELGKLLDREWNFFANVSAENMEFSICTYEVDSEDHVTIISKSPIKTFNEFRKELEQEFNK